MNSDPVPIGAQGPLAFALAYCRLGWAVFPLRPGTKQPESRLVPRGHLNATADVATVRRWWTENPQCGVGIALKVSGLVVIDVDPRNGGLDTFDRLCSAHGAIDSDVICLTGNGGTHYYYANERGLLYPGKLGPGVDLKSDGYMVAPGSTHPDTGREYCWEASSDPMEGMVPSTAPPWMQDLARLPAGVAVPLPAALPCNVPEAKLQSVVAALQHVPADDRETWLRVGMAVHNEMPDAHGYALWRAWSATSAKFDEVDQVRVWRSFKRRGLDGVTFASIFALGQENGWHNTGDGPSVPPVAEPDGTALLNLHQLAAAAGAVRWLIKGVLPANSVGMIFGASGTFKSFLALDAALHVAHGMQWLGRRTRQGKVVFLAAEGGAGLWRRIFAWHQHRGLRWEVISDTFRVYPRPLLLDREGEVKWLRERIEQEMGEVALVLVDTMSQTYSGNENAADEVASYLRLCGQHLRDPFGAAVAIVDHTGHNEGERPRGSSAKLANTDWMMGVHRDTKAKTMAAVLSFQKVKDGDRPADAEFLLTEVGLGPDEDGDEITSLAAEHVNNVAAILKSDAEKALTAEAAVQLIVVQAGGEISERDLHDAFQAATLKVDPEVNDSTLRSRLRRAKKILIETHRLERVEIPGRGVIFRRLGA